MSVILQDTTGKRQMITKGAVEEILSICSFIEIDGTVKPLTQEEYDHALQLYKSYNADGLRMLGVAQKNQLKSDNVFSVGDEHDIAKETADIILLEKDLMVLEHGIVTGRQTFGNVMKYIVMATSGNLGNMISMIIAGLFLPFLPMLPLHILTQNLICDLSTFGMSFDNVDDDYLAKPQSWNTRSILRFMLVMGPLSSIFDILCFLLMYYPMGWNSAATMPLFHAGWFAFGTCSQIIIIHVIRSLRPIWDKSTRKVPSVPLIWSSLVAAAATLSIAFLPLATAFDMGVLPLRFIWILLALIVLYALSLEFTKQKYYQKFGVWIAS